MNQSQRSHSNLGMSKSHYIPDQNRTSSAFYKREEIPINRLDLQLARYEEFKKNYKRNEQQQSYYPYRDMNRSYVEEKPSKIYRPLMGDKHLQTQQYDYDNYKQASPIKIELNYTIPSKKSVVLDSAAYLREREQIMSSFMSNAEIERIKRIYFRR